MKIPSATTKNVSENMPSWVVYLKDYCGAKTWGWKNWLEFIEQGETPLKTIPTEHELLRAVQLAEEAGEITEDTKVTAKRLAYWVFQWRNRNYKNALLPQNIEDKVWEMMRKASTHLERWCLLCDGGESPEVGSDEYYARMKIWGWANQQELDRRAGLRWTDWEEAKYEIKRKMLARVAQTLDNNNDDIPF